MKQKLILLPVLFSLGCSDFFMSYTNQGHPRIPPPDYWERTDTLGSASVTLETQSKLILFLKLDPSAQAQAVYLRNGQNQVLAWDSLPTDTILVLDSTEVQQKSVSYSFYLEYRVVQEDAPSLLDSISLQSIKTWEARQEILPKQEWVKSTIPIAAGDSLKLSLDCSPKVCDADLKNLAGTVLWSKQNARFYRHRFNQNDTLTFMIENNSDNSLIHQDTAIVYRTIPLQ